MLKNLPAMLFVPQLRRQGSLMYFTPSRTHAYRVGEWMLVVQNNASFISLYIVDLSGKEAERFHVKYLPSIYGNGPGLEAGASIDHVCLYESDTRMKRLDGYRLAVLLRDRLVVLDLALQLMDCFQLGDTLSILPGHGCLMAVGPASFTVLAGKSLTPYYLAATSITASRPALSFGPKAEVLSCTLCGTVPVCVIRCVDTIKIFWGTRPIRSLKTASGSGGRYVACNGRVFRIRKHAVEVYGVGSRLVLENTIQAQDGAYFADVLSTYGGHTVIELCSEGASSRYLYENGARLPAECNIVADLPLFSILEKDGKILLDVGDQEGIENPEDLNEVSGYLLLPNPTDGQLFHKTVMFVLFKSFMRSEHALTGSRLCRELSQFTPRIVGMFDCVNLLDCDTKRYFRRLVSEKTLVDCLIADFHPVGYQFAQYKSVYDLLVAINTGSSTPDVPADFPSDMLNAVLETAKRKGKHDVFLHLIDRACSMDDANFLMSAPVECYQNKKKLASALIEFALTKHCIGHAVDYLYGFYHLIPLLLLKDNGELQYRMYKRLLSRMNSSSGPADFDFRLVDLMLDAGRKDLGCILGYALYASSKEAPQRDERRRILEKVRKNIGDYVLVLNGRFVGYENLAEEGAGLL